MRNGHLKCAGMLPQTANTGTLKDEEAADFAGGGSSSRQLQRDLDAKTTELSAERQQLAAAQADITQLKAQLAALAPMDDDDDINFDSDDDVDMPGRFTSPFRLPSPPSLPLFPSLSLTHAARAMVCPPKRHHHPIPLLSALRLVRMATPSLDFIHRSTTLIPFPKSG